MSPLSAAGASRWKAAPSRSPGTFTLISIATRAIWRHSHRPGRLPFPDAWATEILAIHSPFLASPVEDKWRVMGALQGMYSHPGVHSAEELEVGSDHQITFDWPLLFWALESAGFHDIVDRTGEVSDSHTEGWSAAVPHFSLIAQAGKAE